jgi:site-specific recombinase XerD
MASIQKFARLGHRIYWRLYLPDGSYREKYKASSHKSILREILPDILKIEALSRKNELTGDILLRALNLKLITRTELNLFSQSVEIQENHYLHQLRTDYELKSKTQSSSEHSHMANLSKAAIIENYFSNTPIHQITPELIEAFRADRKKTVGNTTVNHDIKALRKYLDIAINKGYIKENPARKLTLLREPKDRIPRCFYPSELTTFFKELKNFHHLLNGDFDFIMRCFFYTGLRRSELCDLKPENIKLHLRQIHLIGKGQKARVVGIHHSLVKEFKRRVKRGYILPRSINPSSISHAFKKVARYIGLPEALTLHSLRHTYISYLLEKGVPTKRVRELAGHFSLIVTDKYTHALPSTKVEEDVLDFENPA